MSPSSKPVLGVFLTPHQHSASNDSLTHTVQQIFNRIQMSGVVQYINLGQIY